MTDGDFDGRAQLTYRVWHTKYWRLGETRFLCQSRCVNK